MFDIEINGHEMTRQPWDVDNHIVPHNVANRDKNLNQHSKSELMQTWVSIYAWDS